jgi:hypothetical protein
VEYVGIYPFGDNGTGHKIPVTPKGRKPCTILVYPSTDHAMRNVVKGLAFHWPAYVDGFLDQQVEVDPQQGDQQRIVKRQRAFARVQGGSVRELVADGSAGSRAATGGIRGGHR